LFQNWEKFFNIETKIQGAQGDPYLKFSKATGFTMIKNWVTMAKENNWLHDVMLFPDKKDGIELEFLLPYSNDKFILNVHGFMDLVIESNSKIYILDWKTGKHHEESYKNQAIIYSWALYKKYGLIEDCVRFVHPTKKVNDIKDVKVKDEDYIKIKNVVDDIFNAIDNDYYPKIKDDKKCGYCNWTDCENNKNKALKKLQEE